MEPFITLNNITIRLKDKFLFEGTSWVMSKGEHWLIIGPNGSGKTTFVKAIAGLLPLKNGEIILNFLEREKYPYPALHREKLTYLSFEVHKDIFEKDSLERDYQEFAGKKIKGITVKDYLKVTRVKSLESRENEWEDVFNIKDLLDREIITLSTGELRKVLIVKALQKNPKLIILDEPFDGLDKSSRQQLMDIIEQLENKIHVLLITHKINEIPKNITHIMVIKNGKIDSFGKKEQMKSIQSYMYTRHSGERSETEIKQKKGFWKDRNDAILEMKNVNVQIDGKDILKNINWQIREGENWVILGPNGAGKSTFVKLILGDHSQAFSNDIKVFGKKLGVGISVWDIKQYIGLVSNELLFKFPKNISSIQVILSGFFDSTGLYQKPSRNQIKKANNWVIKLELKDLINENFNELSSGQKKIILIVRSLVKNPKLLILDEPCHGLDIKNRQRVLQIIEKISKLKTNILYITHNEDEIVPTITHRLFLENGEIVGLV